MKAILRLFLAALLTMPVFLVLIRIESLPAFLYSDTGYTLLHPLFVLFGAVGVEGHESVVAGILLALSFIVAAVLVWRAAALLERRQRANL
jgi:uncharacterized membrane protein (DUF485 family)